MCLTITIHIVKDRISLFFEGIVKMNVLFLQHSRRDAGVVERGGLENRCALTGTGGSNPFLSEIQ